MRRAIYALIIALLSLSSALPQVSAQDVNPCPYSFTTTIEMPPLSQQAQAAYTAAGGTGATITAMALIGNCANSPSDALPVFSSYAYETDYYVTLPVTDLTDNAAIGAELTPLLTTLVTIPPDQELGSGDYSVFFVTLTSPGGQKKLAFNEEVVKQGFSQGWSSASLLQLSGKPAFPGSSGTCFFNWNRYPLRALTMPLQSAMIAAGLRSVELSASAFGEDCIDSQTNKLVGFGSQSTDFQATAAVPSLDDKEAIGSLILSLYGIINNLPPDAIPAPPGQLLLTLFAGDKQDFHQLSFMSLKQAVDQGLSGAALLDALGWQS